MRKMITPLTIITVLTTHIVCFGSTNIAFMQEAERSVGVFDTSILSDLESDVITNAEIIDLFLGIAFLIGIILIIRIMTGRANTQRRLMKRKIDEATKEVRRQKEEIIKQSEELHQAYEEIKTKNAAIEEAFQHLSDSYAKQRDLSKFKEMTTAMIVHDFKNSLNTVISFSQGEPSPRELKSINQSGKKMLNMVLNMLDVQKFEDTEVSLSQSEQFVGELIKSVIDQMDFLIEQNNITIHYSSARNFLCYIDHELCGRVISNILINAIKYSPPNGRIEIRSREADGFVEISFSDEGPGIPEKMLARIFDKYTQVSPRKSGTIKSTGLGLAFCKMVVEAHGGKIWADSKEGDGATFFMRFPLVADYDFKDDDKHKRISIGKKEFDVVKLGSLKSSMKDLKSFEVFDYTDIMGIIDKITDENEEVVYWRNNLINVVQNVNENEYQRLIALLDEES